MMKLKTLPNVVAAELLRFMADHEQFEATSAHVGVDISLAEVRSLLRELSQLLIRYASASEEEEFADIQTDLTPRARQMLATLSPEESEALLKTFATSRRK